jgi:hypothetical protein
LAIRRQIDQHCRNEIKLLVRNVRVGTTKADASFGQGRRPVLCSR